MKTQISNALKHLFLNYLVFLAGLICITGCAGLGHHSDPLARWQPLFGREYEKVDSAVIGDYRDYVRNLTPEERDRVGPIFLFENASGQHAVRFTIGLRGTFWEHVLIYDNDNKRIRIIKYVGGHYVS